jgi:protocatechuate 3,4-dioxygenase, alpha subunit
MSRIPSASQTVGPYFNFALTTNPQLGTLTCAGVPGERIRLEFRVTDGGGAPAEGDCIIEIWQADPAGRYPHALDTGSGGAPGFCGFGRLETDQNGCCAFETVKPGRAAGFDHRLQAPHINVIVFARGLLKHLHTRVYFAGEPANVEDPVLALVPEERRATLLAQPVEGAPAAWHFPIRLQGDGETVFFDV